MSDLFIDSAQHGGQLGEGYGRAKTKVQILVMGLPCI
jgi:hypothetical protein